MPVTALGEEIRRCPNSAPAVLILDLTRVLFLGAAGLTVLVEAHQVAGRETVVRVVANSRIVLRPMQMTETDQVLAVFGSVEQAMAVP